MNPLRMIGNLRLRNKILLLVSVPIAALFFTSWGLLLQLHKDKEAATNFEAASALSLKTSALVHEVQKERGSSAGFLASKGEAFGDIVINQRVLTDKALQSYSEQLKLFNPAIYGPAFEENINKIDSLINKVGRMRNDVSGMSTTVGESVAFYTSLNTQLLNVSDSLARHAPKGDIANSAAAFATFLQSKERAGIERAVLSTVFAKDSFSKASFDKFSNLVNTQNIYLAVFKDMADEQKRSFYDSKMSHASIADVERMRSVAFENAEKGGFGIDAEHWFKTITLKINQLKAVENYLGSQLNEQASAVVAELSQQNRETTAAIAVAVLLSLIMIVVITRSVDSSISKALQLAKSIASGDLTLELQSQHKDEAGQLLTSLNHMQSELNRVISNSFSASESVAAGAEQISLNSESLINKTNDQAENLETTASSTEEIATTIKRNADFAIEAREVSKLTSSEAEHGGEVVNNAIVAMEEINEASKKIASITGVIDEIAFQTNLLALNAAVEAARAGEQGKGFAVVASEVRSLAGRSAEAAKEIKDLIDDSVKKVEAGAEYVDQSGIALEKIVGSVKKVNQIISDIAVASEEQSIGVDTINQSMAKMNTITRENTVIVQDASSAGITMAQKAAYLTDNLSYFTLRSLPDHSQTGEANTFSTVLSPVVVDSDAYAMNSDVYLKAANSK